MAGSRLKFGNVVLCEDVREEIRGKTTLVGTMSGNLTVPRFPATVQIASFIEFYEASGGEQIRLEFEYGTTIGNGVFDVPPSITRGNIIMGRMLVKFEKAGKILIKASVDGGRSRTILSRSLEKEAVA